MEDGACVHSRIADDPGFRTGLVDEAQHEGGVDIKARRRYDVGKSLQDGTALGNIVDQARDGEIALGKRAEIEPRDNPKVVCSPLECSVKITVRGLVHVGDSASGQYNLLSVSMDTASNAVELKYVSERRLIPQNSRHCRKPIRHAGKSAKCLLQQATLPLRQDHCGLQRPRH